MYDAWNGIPDSDDRKRERYLTYMQANLENSVQMSLLAALLDHLGYIPVVENDDDASSSVDVPNDHGLIDWVAWRTANPVTLEMEGDKALARSYLESRPIVEFAMPTKG